MDTLYFRQLFVRMAQTTLYITLLTTLPVLLSLAPQASTAPDSDEEIDEACLHPNALDNLHLYSRAEQIDRLSHALQGMINNSPLCHPFPTQNTFSSAANSKEKGEKEGLPGSQATTKAGTDSKTENPAEPQQEELTSETTDPIDPSQNNGKLPEDIPSVNNDDTIARLLRSAAMDETNPIIQADLWNEYRRYVGLPTPVSNP